MKLSVDDYLEQNRGAGGANQPLESSSLPEDYDTPFSSPGDVPKVRDDADSLPQADSNVDEHELYDQGIDRAAELRSPAGQGDTSVDSDDNPDALYTDDDLV